MASDLKKLLPSTRDRITGLRSSLEEPLSFDPARKQALFKECYEVIWDTDPAEPVDAARAAYLRAYDGQVDPSGICIPTIDAVKKSILHTNNSCAGPDGIPFAYYRKMADIYAPIALEMFEDLSRGAKAPKGFNAGLLFLLPKGSSGLVTDTRPLSVTNANNRIIASLGAQAIESSLSNLIGISQTGFMSGRICDTNICALAERFYTDCDAKRSDYILFLDIKKAFDSVHHSWIHSCLKKANFPSWFRSLVQGLLHDVQVAPVMGADSQEWIPIKLGVKQGCPLSPLLFIIAIDPLLRALERQGSSCFAYADDMAIPGDLNGGTYLARRYFSRYHGQSGGPSRSSSSARRSSAFLSIRKC